MKFINLLIVLASAVAAADDSGTADSGAPECYKKTAFSIGWFWIAVIVVNICVGAVAGVKGAKSQPEGGERDLLGDYRRV